MTTPEDESPHLTPINLTRTQAAKLIEELREKIAGMRSESLEDKGALIMILAKRGIEPLRQCEGDAHSNPHIDNCMRCAPRWGWLGSKVVVR